MGACGVVEGKGLLGSRSWCVGCLKKCHIPKIIAALHPFILFSLLLLLFCVKL